MNTNQSDGDARQADKAQVEKTVKVRIGELQPAKVNIDDEAAVQQRSGDGNVPAPVIEVWGDAVSLTFCTPSEAKSEFNRLVEWYGRAITNTDEG